MGRSFNILLTQFILLPI